MQEAIDRVMMTYGLIADLTPEQESNLREAISAHLKTKTETDPNKLAVEGLRFAREVTQ